MRKLIPALLVGLTVSWSAPLHAQQQPGWLSQILAAAQLPVRTAEARREGVRDEEIRTAIEAMKKEKVPAHDAVVVFDSSRAARRDNGPVDNFGAFVQSQLAAGKRGRALAAAIRAEHVRQGKGRGNAAAGRGQAGQGGAGRDTGRAAGRGRADDDTARGRGRGAEPAGRPAGKPEKPDDRGQGRGKPGKPNR